MAMKPKKVAKAMSFVSTFLHAPKSRAKNATMAWMSHTRKLMKASTSLTMKSIMRFKGSWLFEIA